MAERDDALAAAKRSGSLEEWQKAWKMTPDGITEQEWQYYQNMDPRRMNPEIREKVESAMGWKEADVAEAQEIADAFLRVAKPRGHVPAENLERYRRIRKAAQNLGSLGGQVSGMGEYEDANTLWALEAKYNRMANELRVDLPEEKES